MRKYTCRLIGKFSRYAASWGLRASIMMGGKLANSYVEGENEAGEYTLSYSSFCLRYICFAHMATCYLINCSPGSAHFAGSRRNYCPCSEVTTCQRPRRRAISFFFSWWRFKSTVSLASVSRICKLATRIKPLYKKLSSFLESYAPFHQWFLGHTLESTSAFLTPCPTPSHLRRSLLVTLVEATQQLCLPTESSPSDVTLRACIVDDRLWTYRLNHTEST
jgi:hypothetical protein